MNIPAKLLATNQNTHSVIIFQTTTKTQGPEVNKVQWS